MKRFFAAACAVGLAVFGLAGTAAAEPTTTFISVAGGPNLYSPGIWETGETSVGWRAGVVQSMKKGRSFYAGVNSDYGLNAPAAVMNGGLYIGMLTHKGLLRTGLVLQAAQYDEKDAIGEYQTHWNGRFLGEVGVSVPLGSVLYLNPSVMMGPSVGHRNGLSSQLGLTLEFRVPYYTSP